MCRLSAAGRSSGLGWTVLVASITMTADELTRRAVAFIERNAGRPFFLFFSLHDVHVPRVPMLVRWPDRVEPGVSPALVCQIDFLASLAALTGVPLGDADAPDSLNMLPALLGTSPQSRDHLVQHAGTLALREGPWKYILPGGGRRWNRNTNTELGNDLAGKLYRLDEDPGEQDNRIADFPQRAQQLRERLESIRSTGRSRPVR